MVNGKASEIGGKASQSDTSYTPTNDSLVDMAIDFVDNNDEEEL